MKIIKTYYINKKCKDVLYKYVCNWLKIRKEKIRNQKNFTDGCVFRLGAPGGGGMHQAGCLKLCGMSNKAIFSPFAALSLEKRTFIYSTNKSRLKRLKIAFARKQYGRIACMQ